ncbi:phage baseplate assembly protein V [Spirosoma sp.]|uniref:type VI secretion system Vgr family protein n=1 Tax=Spirosoma sp. TaxID=1899569 RepID=UPI0026053FDB|nr:phage baseplate assembly protein V [Spirosoma sp.]MCX6216956.1 phage baseplate assembly protein V [Spirosoma sp.]
MAQQVEVNVIVGQKRITHFTSLQINQSLFTHHTFAIVVPFEALENKEDFFFKSAHQDVCGKPISISFKPLFKNVTSSFQFNGVVTELILQNNSELVNSFIIKGYSPTFLAEDGVQRRAFVGQTLTQIMNGVLRDYPQNLLPRSVAPVYANSIDYKAQYDESNFDFLNRLAAEYGEWFYYNGTQLVVGKAPTQVESFVVDGIQTFDIAIGLKPNLFGMYHYNSTKHEEYVSKGTPVGLGNLGSFAYQQSQGLFGRSAQLWPLRNIQFQSELDETVQTVNATNAADLVRFQGVGENPNLNVGVIVDVTAQKLVKPGQYKRENAGQYRITHISHTVDNIGNYENNFEAIPSAADYPPRNPTVRMPIALPEIATVIKNEDPLKLGRVRVQFHWPNQMQGKSSWMRVTFPYTGSSRGMLFVPETNDQVLISYEANHVDFPVVVGSLYHKSPANDYWFDDNLQKVIRTKGGNKIVFKDKKGEQEIFITNANKKGTSMHFSFKDDGTITLKTEGLIQLEAKDIKMTAEESIEMTAKNLTITVEEDIKAIAENTSSSSQQEVTIEAGQDANIQATTVHVDGGRVVDVKAPKIKLNS